jgi:hypothetical protein
LLFTQVINYNKRLNLIWQRKCRCRPSASDFGNCGGPITSASELILSLAFMFPTWAKLGGFSRLEAPGPGGVVSALVVGGAVGVFFGLIFGGAKGKWLRQVFGPEQPYEEFPASIRPARPDAHPGETCQ